MKNWLLSANVLGFYFLTLLACPSKQPQISSSTDPAVKETVVDTNHLQTDTSGSAGSSSTTPSKEEKYQQGSGEKHEAPKHGTPDDMKLDSIKESKKKKKG